MGSEGVVIRPSRDDDVAAVAAIYGHHVLRGTASFEEVPPEPDEIARRRRGVIECGLPYLVAERSGCVLGFSYAGRYHTRLGYRFTVEDSIYVDAAAVGRGIGRALLAGLLERCTEQGYRQMVAVIGSSDNWASIRLHQALGFARVGVLGSIGFKFGRWVDIVLMQRSLGPGATTPPRELGPSKTGGEHD
jgi:phosphinothricin acetyltransferase